MGPKCVNLTYMEISRNSKASCAWMLPPWVIWNYKFFHSKVAFLRPMSFNTKLSREKPNLAWLRAKFATNDAQDVKSVSLSRINKLFTRSPFYVTSKCTLIKNSQSIVNLQHFIGSSMFPVSTEQHFKTSFATLKLWILLSSANLENTTTTDHLNPSFVCGVSEFVTSA